MKTSILAKSMRRILLAVSFCAKASMSAFAQMSPCLVEAESFVDKGGWVVDPQFVEQMGSPYLLAHGKGIPVADAKTMVNIKPGRVRAFVRTRDWTPDWKGEKPGRFQLVLGGQTFPNTLGVAPDTWGWVDAGAVKVGKGPQVLALHDLTGFEGRCDAIYLCPEDTAMPPNAPAALAAWRAEMRGEVGAPGDVIKADFVVVGGGMAGAAAAVAAAEAGMNVAIVQDRPMLGGNASDEIRVKTEAKRREYHWIVDAIKNTPANGNSMAADDARRMNFVKSYKNISINTGWRAYGVVTNAARKIVAVDARNVETGARRRFVAPLYCDATGDGWLGYWAGAAYMLGREAKDEYDEPKRAPKVSDRSTMGNSLLWTTKTQTDDYEFPDVPWATKVSGSVSALKGTWQWEAGLDPAEDTIDDAEMLRDRLFRAIYGSFWTAKQKSENAKRIFNWVPYIAGKRESRRIIGDCVVSEKDVTECRRFEDAIGIATWTIDLHWKKGESGFLAETTHTKVKPWWMPYRSLCCRDVPNLFLAGRCASYTHVAFGSSRVMHSGAQQGVAVGYAASLCKKYGCLPRAIHKDASKIKELQTLLNLKQSEKNMKDYKWPEPISLDGAKDCKKAEIFRDADDADSEPTHYVHEFKRVKAGEKLTFRVAPGGGFAVRFDRSPCGSAKLPPFVSLVKNVYAPTDDNVSQIAALALPGVRLADLDGAYLGCRFRGVHVVNKGGAGRGCNVRRSPDGKGLRVEFQMREDRYVKCVMVDLTDGEGGVWARKVGTGYRETSKSVNVGFHFGDAMRNVGYEVYGLFASPTAPKPLPVIPQPMVWRPGKGECDLTAAKVDIKVNAKSGLGEEGYTMDIAPGQIEIVAGGDTGAVWARQTLAQLKAHGDRAECGFIRDVPKYRVRAFMMDVGRMHHSMDFMCDLAKTMSYYKMNVLHVHLNDNAGGKDPNKYAAFRLESETYPALTAKDGHYTKKEFRDFMLFCRSIGVTVIPEIDVPAHSLAFTRVRPDFASKKYGADHLDLDKSAEILAWLKPLFAEYMTGKEPTFIGPYVHVGTDEYNRREAERFRAFQDAMLKMVKGFGYKPCAWGSLSNAEGKTPVIAGRDIMIDQWNNRYYAPAQVFKDGYSVVSIPDKIVYIVPFGGYYNDYFDHRHIYETWEPRNLWRYRVPEEYMDQLLGGKFALWNDLCGKKKDGTPYTEADNWDRIHPALQTFAQKMWRGADTGMEWNEFSALANSLKEPESVKSTHKHQL